MPTPLCLLARKHGSDKCSAKHSYTEWYFREFNDRRESVRKVVEIGVGEGASLRMWREFFPNAMIYGADNRHERLFQEDRIACYPVDQGSAYSLQLLSHFIGADVDLFIDDGSHKPEHQDFTCHAMMPLLQRSVTYVIEDVSSRYDIPHLSPYTVEMPELEHRRRHDNRLIVVRHRAQS